MKTFLISVSLFLSVAHAGDRNSAYNLICKPLTFESDRASCMNRVKNYSYFDDRALKMCKAATFDDNKVACLDLIGDKAYEDFEMNNCINQTFESKKMDCLQESGSPYNPDQDRACVPRQETISQLDASLRDLRSGNLKGADSRISYLLNRFTECRR